MTTRADVTGFVSARRMAVVGASSSGKKFGAMAYRELKKKGYELFPVHPAAAEIEGDRAYASLADLPEGVERLLVVVPPVRSVEVVREARQAGISRIWLQQGAESDEAVRFCEENGVSVVHGHCILMFADPVGFPHRMHRWVWGLIGRLPK